MKKIIIIDESVVKFSIKYMMEYLRKTYPGRQVCMLESTYLEIINGKDPLRNKVRKELAAAYNEVVPKNEEEIIFPTRDIDLKFVDHTKIEKIDDVMSNLISSLSFREIEQKRSFVKQMEALFFLKKQYDVLYVCNNMLKVSLARRNAIQTTGYQIDQSSFFEVVYTPSSHEEYVQLTKKATLDPKVFDGKIVRYHQKFLTIRWKSQEEVYCLVEGRWQKLDLEDQYKLGDVLPNGKTFTFEPRSREQKILYATLLRFHEHIRMFFVTGPAGTGKTYSLLPLLLHLKNKHAKRYSRGLNLVKTKAYVDDQDDGHLPGNDHQKNVPLYDSMREVFDKLNIPTTLFDDDYDAKKSKENTHLLLIKKVRGKNLDNCLTFGDEGQNIMLSSGKTLVQRINDTSLTCISGDSHQVDNNRRMGLNSETSAFSFILSEMIQSPLVFHVHMNVVLRSELVKLANELDG